MTLTIPESTFIVTFTALGFALVTNLLTLKLVDLDAERRMKAEISQFTKELRAAIASRDREKEERLRKKEPVIRQMTAKVQTARFKVTGITFVPFILLYYLMASLLGGFGVTVAYSPFEIPFVSSLGSNGFYDVSLFGWYIITSFAFNGLITKLMGTST